MHGVGPRHAACSMPSMRLSVVFALLTVTSAAGAELRDRAAPDEAPPPRVDVGWRVGGGAGPSSGYLFTGVDAGYRLVPELVVGAYAAKTLTTMAYGADSCEGDGCLGFSRVGARAELHLVPGFVIDPWASLGGGARVTERGSSAEVLVGAGLDLRPMRSVAVGAFVTLSPNRAAAMSGGTTDVGLRLTLSWDAVQPRPARASASSAPLRF